MEAWFANGRIVDLLIAFTLLEGAALVVLHRISGRGVPPREWLLNLVSGLCLMAALRTALAGGAWFWIAPWLALAGAAHALDLARLWRRRTPTA